MEYKVGDRLTTGFEDCRQVPICNFPYDVLDGIEPEVASDDDTFWKMQSAILEELLRWLTEPKTDRGVDARIRALTMFLCPSLLIDTTAPIDQSLMDELNTALVRIQEKFPPCPGYFEKIRSLQPRLREIRARR